MRRFSSRNQLVTLSEINVTPLLDLAFVLLIIFIITTPLLEQSLSLKLPNGGEAKQTANPGDVVTVEPFRAAAFPVVKDLVTDRSAFDKIQSAGGFITVRAGSAPEANGLPVPKPDADLAMDAATCIGCGACVAACKNASAMLFVAAKVSHLGLMPQGQAERDRRVLAMVGTMDELGFGNCTNYYECSAACPKLISHDFIARMNGDYLKASFRAALKPESAGASGGV